MLVVGSDVREGSMIESVGTRLACSLAAVAGFAFTVACFFPGYMSPDSTSQLLQGRAMRFNSWHPPVMSLLWGLLDRVVPGPGGMLIFHNLMFWIGLSLFVYHLGFPRGWAAAAILLVGISPPIFALLSTIWKDVGMGCALLLACGLLLRAERRHSKTAWALALISLWYALGVRHNAIIAVLPLAIWAALISRSLYTSAKANSGLSIALRTCLLVGLLAVTSAGVNKLLAREVSIPLAQTIMVHDLVGISLETNQLYLPDYLIEALGSREVSALRPLYTPDEIVPLFCCDANYRRFPGVTEQDKLWSLFATWRSTIPRHLGAYIKHRAKVFKSEFAIGRGSVCLPFWNGIDPNPVNLVFHPNAVNRRAMNILDRVKDGPLFWGWLFLVLLGALLIIFLVRTSEDAAAARLIGLSGLLYATAYFFISTTCDFRMHWWSILTVFLLLLLAIRRGVIRVAQRATAATARK